MIFSKKSSSYESYSEMMQFINPIVILVFGSLLGDLLVRIFLFCKYGYSKATKSWRKCFKKTLLGYDRVRIMEECSKIKT